MLDATVFVSPETQDGKKYSVFRMSSFLPTQATVLNNLF